LPFSLREFLQSHEFAVNCQPLTHLTHLKATPHSHLAQLLTWHTFSMHLPFFKQYPLGQVLQLEAPAPEQVAQLLSQALHVVQAPSEPLTPAEAEYCPDEQDLLYPICEHVC